MPRAYRKNYDLIYLVHLVHLVHSSVTHIQTKSSAPNIHAITS